MVSAHRCWCEIDVEAIRHNLAFVRKHLESGVRVMFMLKADAYGHGMEAVARVAQEGFCEYIGCANALEGRSLRRLGVRIPILVTSGFLEEEIPLVLAEDLAVTVSEPEDIEALETALQSSSRSIAVHLKVDTGMGRLGCPPEKASALLARLANSAHLRLEGVFSHLACAGESEAFTLTQYKRFSSVSSEKGVLRHLCNSAGMLAAPQAQEDIVRVGLLAYGVCPLQRYQSELTLAMNWKCRIIAVRDLPRGATLSYGATYTAPRRMRVATLSVGYGDGLFRSLSNRGYVLISGERAPIVGRVTMDAILVDVSDLRNVQKSDTAVLLGSSGEDQITPVEMARWAETIPYEIWCHITRRVGKCYFGQ